MKEKKARNRAGLCILVILIALLVVTTGCIGSNLKPFEYNSNGYAIGSILAIEGETYQEINIYMFEEIFEKLSKQGVESFEETLLGGVNYNNGVDDWKFKIYGSQNLEKRILLRGKEAYVINDANYPEIYFCRKDVFDSLKEELESMEEVNLDLFK